MTASHWKNLLLIPHGPGHLAINAHTEEYSRFYGFLGTKSTLLGLPEGQSVVRKSPVGTLSSWATPHVDALLQLQPAPGDSVDAGALKRFANPMNRSPMTTTAPPIMSDRRIASNIYVTNWPIWKKASEMRYATKVKPPICSMAHFQLPDSRRVMATVAIHGVAINKNSIKEKPTKGEYVLPKRVRKS